MFLLFFMFQHIQFFSSPSVVFCLEKFKISYSSCHSCSWDWKWLAASLWSALQRCHISGQLTHGNCLGKRWPGAAPHILPIQLICIWGLQITRWISAADKCHSFTYLWVILVYQVVWDHLVSFQLERHYTKTAQRISNHVFFSTV